MLSRRRQWHPPAKVIACMVSAALAALITGCGETAGATASPGTSTPTPTPSATPAPTLAFAPTTAAVCTPSAPVPGCILLGDPRRVPKDCPTTPGRQLAVPRPADDKLPSYGFGVEPIFLSGQNSWFVGGEEAIFLIDSWYSGPVTITGHLNGDPSMQPTFASEKEVDVAAGSTAPYWRTWSGRLSFPKAGCFAISVAGQNIAETIFVYAHSGNPPPG